MAFLNISQAKEALAHIQKLSPSEAKKISKDFTTDSVAFITNPTIAPREKMFFIEDILTHFYQEPVMNFLNSFTQADLNMGILGQNAEDSLYSSVEQFIQDNAVLLDLSLACATIYVPPFFTGPLVIQNKKLFEVLYCYFIDRSLTKQRLIDFAPSLLLTGIYFKLVQNFFQYSDDKCLELLSLLKNKVSLSSLVKSLSSNTLTELGGIQTNGAPCSNSNFFIGIRQNDMINSVLNYNKIHESEFEQTAITPVGTPVFRSMGLEQVGKGNNSFITGSASNINSLFSGNGNSKKRPFEADELNKMESTSNNGSSK